MSSPDKIAFNNDPFFVLLFVSESMYSVNINHVSMWKRRFCPLEIFSLCLLKTGHSC